MYLVFAQKLEQLTKKNIAYSNGSSISRATPENNVHLSYNTSKFRIESDPVVEGGEKAITFTPSDRNSRTNISVDQNENTKVKNINIGIKNDCNLKKNSIESFAKILKEKTTQTENRIGMYGDDLSNCHCLNNSNENKNFEDESAEDNKASGSNDFTNEDFDGPKFSKAKNNASVGKMVSKEKSSIKGTTKINYNEKRIIKDIQPLINSTKSIIPKCKRKLVNTENVQNRSRHSSYESSISQPPKKKQRKEGKLSTLKRPLKMNRACAIHGSKRRKRISNKNIHDEKFWISL